MKQRIFLYAEKGKIVTPDGEYLDQVLLAEGVSADDFFEITDEEYQKIIAEIELTEGAEVYGSGNNVHEVM